MGKLSGTGEHKVILPKYNKVKTDDMLCVIRFICMVVVVCYGYSVLKLFTGLANAALMVCTLMVNNAMDSNTKPETGNIHQLNSTR